MLPVVSKKKKISTLAEVTFSVIVTVLFTDTSFPFFITSEKVSGVIESAQRRHGEHQSNTDDPCHPQKQILVR